MSPVPRFRVGRWSTHPSPGLWGAMAHTTRVTVTLPSSTLAPAGANALIASYLAANPRRSRQLANSSIAAINAEIARVEATDSTATDNGDAHSGDHHDHHDNPSADGQTTATTTTRPPRTTTTRPGPTTTTRPPERRRRDRPRRPPRQVQAQPPLPASMCDRLPP